MDPQRLAARLPQRTQRQLEGRVGTVLALNTDGTIDIDLAGQTLTVPVIPVSPAVGSPVPLVVWDGNLVALAALLVSTGNTLSFWVNGVEMMRLSEGTSDQVMMGNFGSVTVPTLTRISDPDTGWSWHTPDVLGAIIGGTQRLTLDTTTRMSGAGTPYTATWTSSGVAPAIGNGVHDSHYFKIGRQVFVSFSMILGSSSTVGSGNYRWALPVAADSVTSNRVMGHILYLDASGNQYLGAAIIVTSTTFAVFYPGVATGTQLSATGPVVPANGDSYGGILMYEAAA